MDCHIRLFSPRASCRKGRRYQPTGLMFGQARDSLVAAKPDVILIFDTDHYNTFFFDNFPILAIGIDDKFSGPIDEPRGGMPVYSVPSMPKLAEYLHNHTVRTGYDVASLREFGCDHSVMVPLHFVNPGMRVPVIPFFISGHVPPLPSARRCFALGREIRKALEAYPENLRIVIIGTGSFSLEVFGPRIDPGKTDGVPDPEWVHELPLSRGRRHRCVDCRRCRRPHARGRQCRWRAAQLDCHAGLHRQPQAGFSHQTNGKRPRLCRLALGLSYVSARHSQDLPAGSARSRLPRTHAVRPGKGHRRL